MENNDILGGVMTRVLGSWEDNDSFLLCLFVVAISLLSRPLGQRLPYNKGMLLSLSIL